MVCIDVVIADVGDVGRTEQELIGNEVGCLLVRKCDVSIRLEIPCCVSGLDLYALVSPLGVVEAIEDEGGAELTVIEKVSRKFVVAIDPDIETGRTLWTTPTSK